MTFSPIKRKLKLLNRRRCDFENRRKSVLKFIKSNAAAILMGSGEKWLWQIIVGNSKFQIKSQNQAKPYNNNQMGLSGLPGFYVKAIRVFYDQDDLSKRENHLSISRSIRKTFSFLRPRKEDTLTGLMDWISDRGEFGGPIKALQRYLTFGYIGSWATKLWNEIYFTSFFVVFHVVTKMAFLRKKSFLAKWGKLMFNFA